MKVKIVPYLSEIHDGVSRYVASLAAALRALDVTVVTQGDDYDVLHLVEAHRYDPEWREAKLRGKRVVVTVHDLIPERFNLRGPQYTGVAERREILSAADILIAVSRYTKDDIVATYGIPSDKIHVIHNGVNDNSPTLPPADLPPPSPYLLWVGRRAGYKNFFWFVRAIAPLLWRRNWRVICASSQDFGRKERLLIALLGLSRRFQVAHVNETELSRLYRNALCLVMPSKMEGFGLPVIEAFSNGCPVVIPRAHVFPEVAESAPAYYEPGNAKMMRKAIINCTNPEIRSALIKKGRGRSRNFSWKKCALSVCAVYAANKV